MVLFVPEVKANEPKGLLVFQMEDELVGFPSAP
jgi:hypothetical protein